MRLKLSSLARLTLGVGIVSGLPNDSARAQTVDGIAESAPMQLPRDVPASPNALRDLLTDVVPQGLTRLGPFDVLPFVSSSFYYDDNVNGTATNKTTGYVLTVSPGLSLRAVDPGPTQPKSLTLSYVPTFRFFLDGARSDSIDHSGRLGANWAFQKVRLGLGQSVLYTDYADADFGGRTEQLSATTQLTTTWDLGHKTSLAVNGQFSLRDSQGGTKNKEFSNDNWLDYAFTPRVSAGAGVTFGYITSTDDQVDPDGINTNRKYIQLRTRGSYRVTDRISASGSFGLDFREYNGGISDSVTPVWNIGAGYAAWRGATFNAGIYQNFRSSSRTSTQDSINTGINVGYNQLFLHRFNFGLSCGYYRADYQSIVAGLSTARTDDVVNAGATLGTFIYPNWNVSLFYNYFRDISTEDAFGYARNRAGIQTSWRF